jgi:nucleotide-binding universal stress UspA family protein
MSGTDREMPGIIVGTDGSSHSRAAVEWAMREAGVRQVPVTVVTVYQAAVGYWGFRPSYPVGDELARKARAIAEEQADKILSCLDEVARPPAVEVRAVYGMPADVLAEEAREASLLVVGARGAGGFARLLLGSVATQLSHHACCPLVIVPAAGTRP